MDRIDNAMALLLGKIGIDAAVQGLGTATKAAKYPVVLAAKAAGRTVAGIRKYPRLREAGKATQAARRHRAYARPSDARFQARQSNRPVHPGRTHEIALERK
jgi:hypothetical protein